MKFLSVIAFIILWFHGVSYITFDHAVEFIVLSPIIFGVPGGVFCAWINNFFGVKE